MKNFKDRKTTLMKIGQGAILFSSIALPMSIASKKTNASPTKNRFGVPYYIATPSQMRKLLGNPYAGGESDTPTFRYHSFLSGSRSSITRPSIGPTKYSTTLTVKSERTTTAGQGKVILGQIQPTQPKFRSELKVRIQARPQNAIITQQGAAHQGPSTSQQPRRGSGGGSPQQPRRSSSSSSHQTSSSSSTSSSQSDDGNTKGSPGPMIPAKKVTFATQQQVASSQSIVHQKDISKDLTQTSSSSSKKSDPKQDGTTPSPVSAKIVPLTQPKIQHAKTETQPTKPESSYVVTKSINTPPSSRPSTPISSDDDGGSGSVKPKLEGKFVTNSDRSISLLVKQQSSSSSRRGSQSSDVSNVSSGSGSSGLFDVSDVSPSPTPPAPPNTPVPPQELKFSRVQFLKNYYDGVLSQGGDSDKQKTKPVTSVNVQSLKKQFETQGDEQRSTKPTDIKTTGLVTDRINIFEGTSQPSKVIFPKTDGQSQKTQSSVKVQSLKKEFESSSSESTTQQKTKPTPPSSNVTTLKSFFEKSSSTGSSKVILPTNSDGSNNTTTSSSSVGTTSQSATSSTTSSTSTTTTTTSITSKSKSTSTSSSSSTSTSTTTSSTPTSKPKSSSSVSTQTDDATTSSSGATSQTTQQIDRSSGASGDDQRIPGNNIEVIKVKLDLEIDDPTEIEKVIIKTKIRID